jgi:pantoate--beta-alanine ligase
MIIFKEIGALQKHLAKERQKGNSIGFVPTMGALHSGHLSLLTASRQQSGVTVCSIFVNPTQFNDPKDFEKYPVTTASDIRMLIQQETDILFLPSVEEMYPAGLHSTQHYNLGYLESILEGAHRPGHFQGVCQVVHRLLSIVNPDKLFLGQKDYQQCMVLKKLVSLVAAHTEIVVCETVREANGLAMSSRNLRLSPGQQQQATAIYKVLQATRQNLHAKTFGELQQDAATTLLQNGFEKVDYIAVANADTLQLQDLQSRYDGKTPLVALAAAFMGDVRLIDNILLS